MIRRTRPRDVDAVTALDHDLFGPDAWSRGAMVAELFGAGLRSVVADHGRILGYSITRTAGDVTDLQRIAVHPDHRRQRLATLLLRAVLDGDASSRVLLEVRQDNEAGIAFYVAEGFVEIDRRGGYYRDGADAVVMQREAR